VRSLCSLTGKLLAKPFLTVLITPGRAASQLFLGSSGIWSIYHCYGPKGHLISGYFCHAAHSGSVNPDYLCLAKADENKCVINKVSCFISARRQH